MSRTNQSPEYAAPKSAEDWWNTPESLTLISAGITVLLTAGTAIVGIKIDPEDDANYIVTVTAVVAASLNVIFTLWLLRTAQRQLQLMREQSLEQRADSAEQITLITQSHEAERAEAQSQLDSLRDQLMLAQRSHLAEREEAEKSLLVSQSATDEALKTRLDQLAPRVSFTVTEMRIVLHERQIDGQERHTTQLPEIETLIGRSDCWLSVRFFFALKNWGDEPVDVTTAAPWETYRNELLLPGQEWKLRHVFPVSTHSLPDIAERGIRFNENTGECTLVVLVEDIGGLVSDYHVWRVLPMPFRMADRRVILNPDREVGYSKYAHRQRRYHALDQRAQAAGEELDGPIL